MKKLIKICFMIILVFNLSITVTSKCFATTGSVTGTVQYYRVHDSTMNPAWAPPLFWFTLNDVTSAGTCVLFNGNVLFVASSKEELALIISSMTSGHAVSVDYDDSVDLVNGYCRASAMTAGNPPP